MTNLPDPLEKRMIIDLPDQLDRAVRPFDAAAIARVATVEGRPSVLRIIGATAAVVEKPAPVAAHPTWRRPGIDGRGGSTTGRSDRSRRSASAPAFS